MEFHHAGIAAEDAAAAAELFSNLLDAPIVHEESLDELDVVFLDVGGGELEFLEPTGGGTVARYLEREGPSVHHLAFETDAVVEAIGHARSMGIEPIDEEPRPGAAGHDVAFLHPRDTGGVLVEFVGE